jgi:N-acetylmuramoyl-L-alanine amidase
LTMRSLTIATGILFLGLPGCSPGASGDRAALARPVVVIDPGHGGTAQVGGSRPNNATGPGGLQEKAIALTIAIKTAELLNQQGYDVLLTRNADTNLSLANRAAVALNRRAAAFVSIHFNGDRNPAVQGTETWVYVNATSDSRLLAASLLQQLLPVTGYRNRGVKSGTNVDVTNLAHHWPATGTSLVEISFLSNAAEETRLRTPAYQNSLARAIAQGVDDFIRRSSSIPVPAVTPANFTDDAPEP